MSALDWYLKHHAEVHEMIALSLALLNTLIVFLLRLKPLQDWVALAEKRPRIAAFVRLLGAFGIQPIPILQALVDIVRNNASKGTLASAQTLQTSSSKPLISPNPKG